MQTAQQNGQAIGSRDRALSLHLPVVSWFCHSVADISMGKGWMWKLRRERCGADASAGGENRNRESGKQED
ncbi:hypothetical protein ACRRTK_011892 [Alexandromys fortis]